MTDLDKEEKELLKSFEDGEWKPVPDKRHEVGRTSTRCRNGHSRRVSPIRPSFRAFSISTFPDAFGKKVPDTSFLRTLRSAGAAELGDVRQTHPQRTQENNGSSERCGHPTQRHPARSHVGFLITQAPPGSSAVQLP